MIKKGIASIHKLISPSHHAESTSSLFPQLYTDVSRIIIGFLVNTHTNESPTEVSTHPEFYRIHLATGHKIPLPHFDQTGLSDTKHFEQSSYSNLTIGDHTIDLQSERT